MFEHRSSIRFINSYLSGFEKGRRDHLFLSNITY